jgi:tetratricopeptide (TPR) repeat protein
MNDLMKNLLLSEYMMVLVLIILFFITGCGKYLDTLKDPELEPPDSIAGYRELLEDRAMFTDTPALGEIGTDDLYLPDEVLENQPVFIRDAYHWSRDLAEGSTAGNWNCAYQKVYRANVVLAGIDELRNSHTYEETDMLKGWALFCRAMAFYELQEVFGQPYKPVSAAKDLGIPLKLHAGPNEKTGRATVFKTFRQIMQDLQQSALLLPVSIAMANRNRPCKAAAYAMMARVYLTMQNYTAALACADLCLELYPALVDYNSLDQTSDAAFSPLIAEVIYNSLQFSYASGDWQLSPDLYRSFAENDLRKTLFFTEGPQAEAMVFKGFYSAVPVAFAGLATDEVYLIKAECEARTGDLEMALASLNTLLVKRFKTGTYVPFTKDSVPDILRLILAERRKECLFRNLRWSDLRRLNQDSRFAKTLRRVVKGQAYQLPPNDPRYALPVPENEVRFSGAVQNIR